MKILLDIPDGTICAVLNYLIQTPDGLRMCVNSLQSEELRDGAKIKIIPAETGANEC